VIGQRNVIVTHAGKKIFFLFLIIGEIAEQQRNETESLLHNIWIWKLIFFWKFQLHYANKAPCITDAILKLVKNNCWNKIPSWKFLWKNFVRLHILAHGYLYLGNLYCMAIVTL